MAADDGRTSGSSSDKNNVTRMDTLKSGNPWETATYSAYRATLTKKWKLTASKPEWNLPQANQSGTNRKQTGVP